jgi:hypothetical protein
MYTSIILLKAMKEAANAAATAPPAPVVAAVVAVEAPPAGKIVLFSFILCMDRVVCAFFVLRPALDGLHCTYGGYSSRLL